MTIARNVLIDEQRRKHEGVPLPEILIDRVPELDDSIAVRDLLDHLPETQRRLVELVYVDGFSHAEIAVMAGTTTGAVKTALWRARRALQDVLRKEGGDDR